MNEPRGVRQSLPRLPVLGWSAFSGERDAPFPGVLSARHRRYTISGRAGIALALRALGVRPGDQVLVPTYHCPTMISPVVQAGTQPLFYPITASGSPDLNWLQHADLAAVRVMLVTHYFGLPQPMSAVRAFCDAKRIDLIEDCAHTYFGLSDGRPVGSWGDIAIASLTKFFPVPEGGLIVSATRPLNGLELGARGWRDEIKAATDAIELGAVHGRFPGLNSLLGGVFALKNWLRARRDVAGAGGIGNGSDGAGPATKRLLTSTRPAFAARWIADRVHRSRIVELRRRNYAELASRLSRIDGARVLRADLPDAAVPYVFPLYVDDPAASYQSLRAAGIPIFRWDEIWPGTPTLEGDHGLDWSRRVFQLGCHQDLSVEDIEAMAATVRQIVQQA